MAADNGNGAITSFLSEDRVFPPPTEFSRQAHIPSLDEYDALWSRGKTDPEGFWSEMAQIMSVGTSPGQGSRLANPPCSVVRGRDPQRQLQLRRSPLPWPRSQQGRHHLRRRAGRPPGPPLSGPSARGGDLRQRFEVARGVKAGDTVAIYLPMIPEAVIAMLACARIGAVHTVVFGGFSAEALAGRIQDCAAKVLITADGGFRRGKVVPLKQNADEAVSRCPTIESVVVYQRTKQAVAMTAGRDRWWHDLTQGLKADCPPVPVSSEHPLFILYTSGSTGKPKGILHTTGGYLVGAALTTKWVFDLKPTDTYFLHRRRRLDHRAHLLDLRPARQRRDGGDLRRGTQLARRGAVLADHRGLPGLDPLHRPHGDPRVHEVGGPASQRSTTCRASACSGRSASRSTPRRGSGTKRSSGAGAARSSIPGGKPRPARS